MNIDDLRKAIDDLDDTILDLLNRRAEKAIEIGRLKNESGGAIFDPARERRILDRLAGLSRGPLSAADLRDIYGAVFAVNRLLEKTLSVAYYGPPGTFTHLAAQHKFGVGADLRPVDAISDVFRAVEKKEADFGVVPIENTTAGVVPLTLDAFAESKLNICAEVYVDIEHHLLCRCQSLEEIQRVYSHPQAIAQCRIWLKSNLPRAEIIPAGSTSRAAELAAAEAGSAAVGPALAGELHDLPVLRARIHDQPDNRTRFFILGRSPVGPSGKDKTSMVFSVAHKAGALHRALAILSNHQISMTFIQSHPTKETPWEYMFFVDVEGHAALSDLAAALEELRQQTSTLRVLGSYPESD